MNNGLPLVLERCVGREGELRRLRLLLRSARLLTLVGPGGVGKTQLALELARQVRGKARTQVRLVYLDSVPHGELVPETVARALSGRKSALAGLIEAIGDSKLLVVLDSCEHVVESCARLAVSLLHRCPGLRLVATSRENLRVPGEVTFRLGGLSLFKPVTARSSATTPRPDAIRLFVERARAHAPGFRFSGADLGVVAEICRRLDGLPLCIELAARQVATMPSTQILAGLDNQLALLADADRAGPDRHRQLRTTIEWSYRLLTAPEKAVFRRLAVLAGGFDLDAATAVCSGSDVEPEKVLRLVCALEAKSLITRTDDDTDTARFRQLNCIRAYALDQLSVSAEVDATIGRAAAWLVDRTRSLSDTLYFANAELPRLRRDRDNLAAAVEYTDDRDPVRRDLLAVSLARMLWQQRSATPTGKPVTLALRQKEQGRYRTEALVWSALAACVRADHAEALRLAEQAMWIERRHGHPNRLAMALDVMAFVRMCRGELAEAVTAHRECLALVRPLGQPLDTAKCQNCLAWTLLMMGEVAEAELLLAAALPVYRRMATPQEQVTALNSAGILHLANGDIDGAESAFAEVLGTVAPNDYVGSHAVEGLAIVAARRDESARALCLAAAASAVRLRGDFETNPPWRQWVDTAMVLAGNRLDRDEADTAAVAGRQLQGERLRAYALRWPIVETRGLPGRPDRSRPVTNRERQVANLVTDGLTNQEIADRLHLSARTVRTHLTSIHNKLDLRSRTQVAVWAVLQGAGDADL